MTSNPADSGASTLEPMEPATSLAELGLALHGVTAACGRQLWLLIGLPLLVAVLSHVTLRPPPPQYQAHLAFAVDVPPSAVVQGSDEGTAAKIGEALIDDLSRMIGGDAFATAVATHLPPGSRVSPGEIASSLAATDRHRIADVTVTRSAPPNATAAQIQQLQTELKAVAEAVMTELNQNGQQWASILGEDDVRLVVVDYPAVAPVAPTLRARLELPLRIALAFAIALIIAIGREAIDQRLRDDSGAIAAAGAPILGRIPRSRHRRWWSGR